MKCELIDFQGEIKNIPFAILILALICAFSACTESYFYEKKYELPNAQWTYNDTLNFEVDIQDTIKTYNLILDIEHSTDFPYHFLRASIWANKSA